MEVTPQLCSLCGRDPVTRVRFDQDGHAWLVDEYCDPTGEGNPGIRLDTPEAW